MKIIKVLTMISVLAISANSIAGTATGVLTVQAQVADTCTIYSENINFGVINVTPLVAGSATATGKIHTSCTKNTTYTISLGYGNTGTATTGRFLTNSLNTDKLAYNLYSPNKPNTVWGDGNNGTYTLTAISTGLDDVSTVQAQLSLAQNVSAGLYTDSVIITVSY
jgi:spore coat protein U-like protein